MDYPVWLTPGISKGMIIALVAVIHVFVAQFAVGGGIYLAWMESRAHKLNSPDLLHWLERHTRFFLLLTMVFGGLSGVAIWFTISLISPAGTALLTHSFLFVWATEWAFFLVEIIALLVYYCTYPLCRRGVMAPATHLRVGKVYAAAAFLSLILINGIICFMLTPGQAFATGSLFDGFFNPTMLPALVYRTALCLLLAGMFALFTSSRIANLPVRRLVIRTSSLWICIPFLVLAASSFWYLMALPPDRMDAVIRRTADVRPFIIAYGWILPVVFLTGVVAFALAERLRRPLTVVILLIGLICSGSFEWIRETGRRPWLIPGHVYSNSVSMEEGAIAAKEGTAAVSGWIRMLGTNTRLSHGEALFEMQCSPCHAINGHPLNLVPRIARLSREGIVAQLGGQGERLDYMPPFFGNAVDREALASYLDSVRVHKK